MSLVRLWQSAMARLKPMPARGCMVCRALPSKYILLCEYYNPTPISLEYRGHSNKLFKRDFAGEMLEKYSNLELKDYGFSYSKDKNYPLDDITWFLMKKK